MVPLGTGANHCILKNKIFYINNLQSTERTIALLDTKQVTFQNFQLLAWIKLNEEQRPYKQDEHYCFCLCLLVEKQVETCQFVLRSRPPPYLNCPLASHIYI